MYVCMYVSIHSFIHARTHTHRVARCALSAASHTTCRPRPPSPRSARTRSMRSFTLSSSSRPARCFPRPGFTCLAPRPWCFACMTCPCACFDLHSHAGSSARRVCIMQHVVCVCVWLWLCVCVVCVCVSLCV